MRPAIFAILGVVFGWSLMMIQPVFADTSSSSSFVLTDSFSIVGSPSDTSASYTQKGAGGFGANPVPPKVVSSSSSNSNVRSRSATSSSGSSTSTGTATPDSSESSVSTPEPSSSEVSAPTLPADASIPSSSTGGASIIDRVVDTIDAAREVFTTPFRRSPATVPDVTPTQPTVVASTPSATRSTSTAPVQLEVEEPIVLIEESVQPEAVVESEPVSTPELIQAQQAE